MPKEQLYYLVVHLFEENNTPGSDGYHQFWINVQDYESNSWNFLNKHPYCSSLVLVIRLFWNRFITNKGGCVT